MLQEAHVAVEQGVGRGQDPHRLHPRPPLHRALHRHVGEAGEAEVAALPEVAVDRGGERRGEADRRSHESRKAKALPDGSALSFFLFFFFPSLPGNTFCPARRKTLGRILIPKLPPLGLLPSG